MINLFLYKMLKNCAPHKLLRAQGLFYNYKKKRSSHLRSWNHIFFLVILTIKYTCKVCVEDKSPYKEKL